MFKKTVLPIAGAVCLVFSILTLRAYAAVEEIQFSYDDLDHLKAAQYPDGRIDSYTYDAVGNRLSRTVSSSTSNLPPNQPHSPFPAENATDTPPACTLQWSGGDPDTNDLVTYSVFLGTSTNPALFKSGMTDAQLPTGGLKPNTTYY